MGNSALNSFRMRDWLVEWTIVLPKKHEKYIPTWITYNELQSGTDIKFIAKIKYFCVYLVTLNALSIPEIVWVSNDLTLATGCLATEYVWTSLILYHSSLSPLSLTCSAKVLFFLFANLILRRCSFKTFFAFPKHGQFFPIVFHTAIVVRDRTGNWYHLLWGC